MRLKIVIYSKNPFLITLQQIITYLLKLASHPNPNYIFIKIIRLKKNYSSSRRVTFLNLKSNTMKNTLQK